jgi:16S rRNA (adenine1518-N6/adenine1519-N6)-dimethyltransferase
MNYDSQTAILHVLHEQGIALKKRWGQNFLINRGAREKIAGLVAAAAHETVWEIGPGLGALTVLLLPAAGRLIVFEIDRGLVRWLTQEFAGLDRFTLCQGDVLKTWPLAFKNYGMPHTVCGNLPYNSASAIILSFIMQDFLPSRMVFTVQRELALRMAATPGSKNYSGFSVLCRSMFAVESAGELKPGSFFPQPDVVSSIIALTPNPRLRGGRERDWFFRLVKTGFASRRKTFKNNILKAPGLTDDERQRLLDVLGRSHSLDTLRAEELDVDLLVDLALRSMK